MDLIPDHAFGENQKHLTLIALSRNRIKKLGQFAFFSLPYLDFLDLSNNFLEELGNNSFAIQKPNDRKTSLLPHIRINLQSNHIKTISDLAFDNLSRPTALDISFNNLTELSLNVFRPLLPFYMTKIRVKGI